ncbi:MAG: DNA translocase FtsK, partial [Prevotella sp.]|nr:DNA translocase FtsK [Prevotella sp.]
EPVAETSGSEGGSTSGGGGGFTDPLFEEVARAVVMTQQGSTSMIQRRFSIGFNRAGRLMDQLHEAGIVGVAQGAKPREVLISDENSLNALFARLKEPTGI